MDQRTPRVGLRDIAVCHAGRGGPWERRNAVVASGMETNQNAAAAVPMAANVGASQKTWNQRFIARENALATEKPKKAGVRKKANIAVSSPIDTKFTVCRMRH